MLKLPKIMTFFAAISLGACGIVPEPAAETNSQPDVPKTAPIVRSIGDDEVLSRIGTIPAQQVSSGECGLFLWAKREDAPLIMFQRSNGETLMRVDGALQGLNRSSMENQIALQFYRDQQFALGDMSFKVSVTPEQTRTLQQGLKVPSGSISISTESGWSAAIPVAGAIGCQ